MININIVRDRDGFIWEFTVKGHAGFGKRGNDIVCAAVSAVAYTAVGALGELCGIENYITQDGYMKCSIPPEIPEDKKHTARIILESMVIGLKQISHSYMKNVTVLDEEV